MITIEEYKEERAVFGNDTKAINRHSVRVYAASNGKKNILFTIDRTLDRDPPYFELYVPSDKGILSITIKINGKRFWGDGLSWKKAEIIAFEAIRSTEWLFN